ncbi:hypothetical protein [Variovorax saccharolyticus]|uniref:hypothetical protein n=1 Tax=Variovorax saccharolyticus TaxID=3053516 RepID=UPI002578C894|nr:hypothetical protein [Variovorax sp. J22R187]MDM0022654.1 hypothetical protein [Variovorax sp. J22R187]
MDEMQYDAGWWAQPPPRPFPSLRSEAPPVGLRIWRNVALVVSLTIALAWTLKVAVGL